MKWQCLGIRNYSNYPMIIISKRVYPITIFCILLWEPVWIKSPPSLENRGQHKLWPAKSCQKSCRFWGPRATSFCGVPFVHSLLPWFPATVCFQPPRQPGFFSQPKKTRWSTSLWKAFFFCIFTLETLNNLWFTTPSLHQIGAWRFSSCRSSPELFHQNLPASKRIRFFCTWFAWIWTYYKHPKRHCAKMELMATICNTRR